MQFTALVFICFSLCLFGCGEEESSEQSTVVLTPQNASADGTDVRATTTSPSSATVDLSAMMNCWFESTDDTFYSLAGGSLQLGNITVGALAWKFPHVSDAVFFDGTARFFRCVYPNEAADLPERDEFLKRLSGIDVFTTANIQGFNYLNPAIVKWAEQNLVPSVDNMIKQTAFSLVYGIVFESEFRLMAETYLHLLERGDYQSKQSELIAAVSRDPTFNVWTWLGQEYPIPNTLSAYEDPYYKLGFWLRRGVDGTADEIWAVVQKIMKRFDADYYSTLAGKYPNAAVAW